MDFLAQPSILIHNLGMLFRMYDDVEVVIRTQHSFPSSKIEVG